MIWQAGSEIGGVGLDVLQGLKAKQEAKKKRNLLEFEGKMGNSEKGSEGEINQVGCFFFLSLSFEIKFYFHGWNESEYICFELLQGMKNERNRVKKCNSTVSTAAKSRGWQPSLQSISEGGS